MSGAGRNEKQLCGRNNVNERVKERELEFPSLLLSLLSARSSLSSSRFVQCTLRGAHQRQSWTAVSSSSSSVLFLSLRFAIFFSSDYRFSPFLSLRPAWISISFVRTLPFAAHTHDALSLLSLSPYFPSFSLSSWPALSHT